MAAAFAAVTAAAGVLRPLPKTRITGVSCRSRRYQPKPLADLKSRLKNMKSICCSKVDLVAGIDNEEACELVNGVDLAIEDGETIVQAYLLKAVKNNNGTGVLLLSDIFGFEDSSTREFAYRVACNGYNVLVPDLFDGNPWKKGQSMAGFDQWRALQIPERVASNIDSSAKWLVDEFKAAEISGKIGLIGFCYGGARLMETLARDEDSYFGAAVCFYGSGMNPDTANRVKAPVLFICGDDDPQSPASRAEEMAKNMKGSKAVVYNGRGHGFAHRPASQEDDADAEDAFFMMRNWLNNHLLAKSDISS